VVGELVNRWVHLPALTRNRRAPRAVVLGDVTLREGEQSEGVSFSLETKVELARTLERSGVRQIQVGYPGRFERDLEATRAVAAAVEHARVEVVALAFVDDWEAEVDACLASGADIVTVVYRSSDRLQGLLGVTPAEGLARAEAAVARAARGNCQVAFLPSDSTRANPRYLDELWSTASTAGAERVYVADSMGAATPDLMAYLVRRARRAAHVPVGVHCHNDFGLAVANTVAGVTAGAQVVDAAVNGLGDRAGNAPLEEVAAALELLYGVHTGVQLDTLTALSEEFARASGRPLAPNKPISGRAVFVHTLPTHKSAMEADSRAIQAFEPDLVGNTQRLGERVDA
jgi:isopropylmalate/homocitrate/citramalate synthase